MRAEVLQLKADLFNKRISVVGFNQVQHRSYFLLLLSLVLNSKHKKSINRIKICGWYWQSCVNLSGLSADVLTFYYKLFYYDNSGKKSRAVTQGNPHHNPVYPLETPGRICLRDACTRN